MGNHDAGRYMNDTAKTAWYLVEKNKMKMDKQEALGLLDYICEGHRGCDAEFEIGGESYIFATDPDAPLGRLIAIAFGDGRDWVKDCAAANDRDSDIWYAWYDGPVGCFDKRYEFC